MSSTTSEFAPPPPTCSGGRPSAVPQAEVGACPFHPPLPSPPSPVAKKSLVAVRPCMPNQPKPMVLPPFPTSYSPVHPRIPHNPRPRSKGMKERVGGLCCARQRMD